MKVRTTGRTGWVFSLFLFAALLPIGAVRGDGGNLFAKGQFFVDFQGGVAHSRSDDVSEYEKQLSMYDGVALINLRSQNPDRKWLGFYFLKKTDEYYSTAGGMRIGMEYGLSPHVGLGASLQSSFLTLKHVPPLYGLSSPIMLYYYAENGQKPADPYYEPGFYELMGSQFSDQHFGRLSLTLDVTFHLFPSPRLDPYLRFGLGGGLHNEVAGSAALGFRVPVVSHLHLSLELYGNSFAETNVKYGDPSYFRERGGRFGLGFHF